MKTAHWAAMRGDQARLKLLIEGEGEDPDIPSHGSPLSPLSLAAGLGHHEATRYLLDHGASIDRLNGMGGTALYSACLGGHQEIVELLLQRGADPSLHSLGAWSPLIVASAAGYLDIIRALVRRGTDVNHADATGATALWHAARQGQVEAVHELLETGRADHRLANKTGSTPLQAAELAEAHACVLLLQEAERSYLLHKARALYDDSMRRSSAGPPTSPPLPHYCSQGRQGMPVVEVVTSSEGGGGAEQGRTGAVVREVLGYVVRDMDADVYSELSEVMGRVPPIEWVEKKEAEVEGGKRAREEEKAEEKEDQGETGKRRRTR